MLATARRRPAPTPTIQHAHVPAWLGGINTISPVSAMPPEDSCYCWNLIGSDGGLRSRLGYREWVTGIAEEVRTLLAFSGSAQSGAGNRLFAATSAGLYDVSAAREGWTASTAYVVGDIVVNGENVYICDTDGTSDASGGPTGTGADIVDGSTRWDFVEAFRVVSFPISAGSAGRGIACAMSTIAGRFLFYTDEENGLYRYTETTDTWAKVSAGVAALWQPNTGYSTGNQVVNGGVVYVVTAPGVSASSGGPTGGGVGIVDGTVTWDFVSPSVAGVIGPSVADQNAGLSGDPANFVSVTVWKNRAFFTEKNSSRGWYLGIGAIAGEATSYDFGPKFPHGGPLTGLYNWSYDGGSGMDTRLVAISTAGDVSIYGGSDPSSASSFGLQGCWFVGGVVSGRRVATDYGGDLLVLSLLGLLPLSKLVVGGSFEDSKIYATFKIGSLFSRLAAAYKDLDGWAIHIHPTDNALLILVPTLEGAPTEQLVMSFATKGWSRYRALPMFCAEVWNGQLYLGTNDGRVCTNDGYVDDVKLADPTQWTPVEFSVLGAWRSNQRFARVHMVRAIIRAEAPDVVCRSSARYNFDFTEPDPPVGSVGSALGGSSWDAALWDEGVWGGDYSTTHRIQGTLGFGKDVAIAVRGSATARTVYVGTDVMFDEGGLL